jgi:hypothetical protein
MSIKSAWLAPDMPDDDAAFGSHWFLLILLARKAAELGCGSSMQFSQPRR